MIESDVADLFLNTDDFAELIEVWTYYTSTTTPTVCKPTVIVDLPDSSQQLSGGDRNTIRGTVYLPSADFEKTQLMAGGTVRATNGTTYTIRVVTFVLRGSVYRVDSVGEASGGMIPVQVIQGAERYSNARELDPI